MADTTTTTISGQPATATITSLSAHLDALLTRYLHVLDQHERIREQARQHLRAGHLALAEANFHNANRAVRFGQELYDGKMSATLVLDYEGVGEDPDGDLDGVKVGVGGSEDEKKGSSGPELNLAPWRAKGRLLPTRSMTGRKGRDSREDQDLDDQDDVDDETEDGKQDASLSSQSPPLPTPPASRETTPSTATAPNETSTSPDLKTNLASLSLHSPGTTNTPKEQPKNDASSLPADPITQFGILVPPALRTAQKCFRDALLGDSDDTGRDYTAGTATLTYATVDDKERDKDKDESDCKTETKTKEPLGMDLGMDHDDPGPGSRSGLIALAALDAELRMLEIEVRRVRKKIGQSVR